MKHEQQIKWSSDSNAEIHMLANDAEQKKKIIIFKFYQRVIKNGYWNIHNCQPNIFNDRIYVLQFQELWRSFGDTNSAVSNVFGHAKHPA
jgi:hypothetical protein